jgi:hypothetical protein
MTNKEKLTEQLKAFEAVKHQLKHDNEGMDLKTVDHYYEWVSNTITLIEFAIKKEEEFDLIKEKLSQGDTDIKFPFVERSNNND